MQKEFDKDYIVNLNSLMLNSGYEINIGENQEMNIFISNISVSEENLTILCKRIFLIVLKIVKLIL